MNAIFKLTLLLLFFSSCKYSSKKTAHAPIAVEVESNETVEASKDSIESGSIFLPIKANGPQNILSFDNLISRTRAVPDSGRIERFSLIKHGRVSYLPPSFITKYITPKKIDFGFPNHLYAEENYNQAFTFDNVKEYDHFYMLTFYHDNESCCRTLYGATIKKDTMQIINIGVLEYEGGDGGWSGSKHGKWSTDSTFDCVTYSEYDEDFIDDTNSTEINTFWSIINRSKAGMMHEIITDSTKYIGDKKIY